GPAERLGVLFDCARLTVQRRLRRQGFLGDLIPQLAANLPLRVEGDLFQARLALKVDLPQQAIGIPLGRRRGLVELLLGSPAKLRDAALQRLDLGLRLVSVTHDVDSGGADAIGHGSILGILVRWAPRRSTSRRGPSAVKS